jgi:hypothetical protein
MYNVAQILGGLQAQMHDQETEIKLLAKETRRVSQHVAELSSSSSGLEVRIQSVERGLRTVLGIHSSTGLDASIDAIDLPASLASGESPALPSVRDRLLSIREVLARTPATTPSVILPSPVVGTSEERDEDRFIEEILADRIEESILGASGIHLEVSAPSAPSDIETSPDCPRAPHMTPRFTPRKERRSQWRGGGSGTADGRAAARDTDIPPPSPTHIDIDIPEASAASATNGDVALLRRQQEQLQARLDQGSAEMLMMQEELMSIGRGNKEASDRFEQQIFSYVQTLRTSLVEEVTEKVASEFVASSGSAEVKRGRSRDLVQSESRSATSSKIQPCCTESVAENAERKSSTTPSADSGRRSQCGSCPEEPLRKAGSQVGDSELRASPAAALKSSRSEKQSPRNGSHCSTPSSTSSRKSPSLLRCMFPSAQSPAAGGMGGS